MPPRPATVTLRCAGLGRWEDVTMDDTTKIRRLQEQREWMRREIAGIRRTLRTMEPQFSEHRKGWMPEAMIDRMEAELALEPEKD